MSDFRPLRIAMLVRAFPTLSETFIRDLVEDLGRRGHIVDLYSLYVSTTGVSGELSPSIPQPSYLIGPERSLSKAIIRGISRIGQCLTSPRPLLRLTPLAFSQPRIVAEAIHAIPALRNQPTRYDVVHAHFGPTGLLALALHRAQVLMGPLVTTFHGVDLTRYPVEHGPDAYKPLFDSAAWFTVNSGFTEARAVSLGAPTERLQRIPMGIHVSEVPFETRTPTPGEALRLLSVGRLEPVKGFHFGLRAVASLVGEGHDIQYTIIGTGRLEEELRKEADRLGIASRVKFSGPLPFEAVMEEYANHHIFLMPGIVAEDGQEEAQGRVLVEAQASGMPIVATRVGGIPETLAEGAGHLVSPGEPDALAAAIRELSEHPDRWPVMGSRGRRYVEEHFDAGHLLNKLIRVYRGAISARKAAQA